MGALPRPATPGGMQAINAPGDGYMIVDDRGDSIGWAEDGDAQAFAALPERIAREDRVRGVCAGLIMDAEKYPHDDYARSDASLARHIQRILDGEVFA